MEWLCRGSSKGQGPTCPGHSSPTLATFDSRLDFLGGLSTGVQVLGQPADRQFVFPAQPVPNAVPLRRTGAQPGGFLK